MTELLTQARLKELLSFDPETGVFRWLARTATHTVIGEQAGGIDNRGYWRIRLFGKPYAAHRLAWLYVHGAWPQEDIDHINRVRTDNRIANLRDVSRSINMRNTGPRKSSDGRYVGVRLHCSGKYEARIGIDGARRTVGYYATAEAANEARMKALSASA